MMDATLNLNDFKANDPPNNNYSEDCDLYILNDVIDNEVVVDELARELGSLSMDYLANDLHRFRQSGDLSEEARLANLPLVSQFIHGMKTTMREFVEEKFSVTTSEKITITASLYKKGDYLLCHDDLCNDRAIAFVYYLADRQWAAHDGGILRFFHHSEGKPSIDLFLKELLPEFNSMVFFRVSKTSFHEVQEIMGEKSRLSINGWFHSPTANPVPLDENKPEDHFIRSPICQLGRTVLPGRKLADVPINVDYYDPVVRKKLQRQFKEDNVLVASQILQDSWRARVVEELDRADSWQIVGPPLHRRYESIPLEVMNDVDVLAEQLPATKALIDCLLGREWLNFLSYVTRQDFTVIDSKYQPPVFGGELQKWTKGCYSFITDNDSFRTTGLNLIEVAIFLHVDVSADDSGGHFVLARSYNFTPQYYLNFKEIKKSRLIKSLLDENIEEKKRRSKRRVKVVTRINKKSNARIEEIVTEKMKKIEAYRKTMTWENSETRPKENSIIMAMTNTNSASFMSYLTRNQSARVCYYCINLRYLTKAKAKDNSDSDDDDDNDDDDDDDDDEEDDDDEDVDGAKDDDAESDTSEDTP